MPVFIEQPDGDIDATVIEVVGWAAASVPHPTIRVAANGRRVRHTLHNRPDVRRILPDLGFVAGVQARLSVFDLDPCATVEVTMTCDADAAVAHCTLLPAVRQARAAQQTMRRAARDKCLAALVCPSCGKPVGADQAEPTRIVCAACGAAFIDLAHAINMIPAAMMPPRIRLPAVSPAIDGFVAPPMAAVLALVERVGRDGGWVLACGTGRPSARHRHVVQVEIVHDGVTALHGSGDLLALGGALPFADGSFDAAVSIAVLDRVRDPFGCARELLRVVKPGGEVLAGVGSPPEGLGFANHFFKINQLGLEKLFGAGGEVIECAMPAVVHDRLLAVRRLLRDALAELPDEARDAFAAMSVGAAALLDATPTVTTEGMPLEPDWLNMIRVRRR